ncbi:MAG: transglycosylase SLT domain-containing protein [Nitrospinota bacterium]
MRREDRYDSLFRYYAEEAGLASVGLDWLNLKAQALAESGLRPDVVSRAGAVGLAQFMSPTWREWWDGTPGIQEEPHAGGLVDPRDPEDAIKAQAHYMDWLMRQTGSAWRDALIAYNWGIGRWRQWAKEPARALPQETADYVNRVVARWRELAGEGRSQRESLWTSFFRAWARRSSKSSRPTRW